MRRTRLTFATGAATLTLVLASTTGSRTQARLSALPTVVATPPDNPTTPEKVALGRLLFWDPILSGQQDVACATCHHPDFGYAENLDVSIGVNGTGLGAARTFAPGVPTRFVKRNSQTVLNAAFNGLTLDHHTPPAEAPMFWDMRVKSLEAQTLEPIKALEEMRGDLYAEDRALTVVVSRLAAIPEYRRRFEDAFGGRSAVSQLNLGKALAAFERSLVTSNAPFDRYMRGDTSAMTIEQVQGLRRFEAIGCVNCHSGPMFSDFKSHVLGVPDNGRLPATDSGVNQTYAFRTASLRNLDHTAPYMHNGVFGSLREVIAFYDRVSGGRRGGGRNRGGGVDGRGGGGPRGGGTPNPNVTRDQLDPLVRQLNMRGGRQNDLVAFLGALNDDNFDRTIPDSVPSGLPPGGRIGTERREIGTTARLR